MADTYWQNIADAYMQMATELNYRPLWMDGAWQLGEPITNDEAIEYAKWWRKQEDDNFGSIGCSNWSTCKALVYTTEASKVLCGGVGYSYASNDFKTLVSGLLAMATREAQHPTAKPKVEDQ